MLNGLESNAFLADQDVLAAELFPFLAIIR